MVLRTSKLEQMRDWYLKVGFGTVQMTVAAHADVSREGFEHITFTCATLQEFLASYRRLKSAGIEPYWPINHGSTVSMYYRDPDGNCVELEYDIFDAADRAEEFTAGRYVENIVGVAFDPEDMIRRYETGATFASEVVRD